MHSDKKNDTKIGETVRVNRIVRSIVMSSVREIQTKKFEMELDKSIIPRMFQIVAVVSWQVAGVVRDIENLISLRSARRG